ncbi:retinoblastoma-like protein 1 isoform X2 [Antedon mediterranea]|uniref:retinoblastoma-like protein 1 isoform X2 n=1 Tax=Antedon mediterranea TaxID=105859 RepID=UPI003AF453D0
MAPPSEEDGKIRDRFNELCLDLNLDKTTIDVAWEAYQRISLNYTLEGDDLHWLACALYVSCRKSVVPTVGGREMMEGNCVSLTRLLRSSKLSVIQFFNKMKKWSDMANLPQKFRDKVDRLERNFNVSCVIFKKYKPIFIEIFKDPSKDQPRAPRGRKQRRLNCTVTEVFSFCWTLFVQVKGNFPAISDDLVNSYHLLLCCVDLIFANALLANRRDLLNPTFKGLPETYNNCDYHVPAQSPCIIEMLCSLHDGLVIEAKGIKEHWWKPYIKKLFDKRTLKGTPEKLSGLIDSNNFETNSKSINKVYEEYVLTVGDFDETIFLATDANKEIGTPSKSTAAPQTIEEKMKNKRNQKLYQTKSLAPQTPLTNRGYLKEKEHATSTPVSTATQSVSRLQALLTGLGKCPTDTLKAIFAECTTNPTQSITERIKQMGELFCTKFVESSEVHAGSHVDFAKMRLKLAETLYYKVMESIMTEEKKRLQGKKNLGSLLEHDIFHTSLFACCLEIVIFSYNSQRTFPWIIDIFDIPAFHFYKVIELILRAEDGLSRDVVKHLNTVEEAVLQECAWKSNSPLWDVIGDSNSSSSSVPNNSNSVPTCEDVTLPSQIDNGQNSVNSHPPPPQIGSPIMQHPRVRALTGVEPPKRDPVTGSPVSAHDRFSSPSPGSAKRRLFPSESTTSTNSSTPAVQTAQIVTKPNEKIVTVEVQTSQVASNTIEKPAAVQPATEPVAKKPKRTGSVGLFFRKLYHLANVRLLDLCSRLQIEDDLRRKIWTCFVHAIVHHSDLMKDRHLDQLLMCSIYVICKVTRHDQQFQEIMRCYRMQPQAQSHVYRSVLLNGRCSSRASATSQNGSSSSSSPESDHKHKGGPFGQMLARSSSTMPTNSAPPTPTRMAGTASSFEDEERGDLIKYYNSIFVTRVQPFALRFSPADSSDENGLAAHPTLSPLPIVRTHQVSPRKVSNRHQLYISPRKNCIPRSPGNSMVFHINKSPSKDLKEINSMIKMERKTKRAMDFGEESPQKRVCLENQNGNFLRKLHKLNNDRNNGDK